MLFLNFIVNTENPSISSIQGQILSNGLSIPHKIERTKDLQIWHLKFRPSTFGTYKIHLIHNGLALLSKPKKKDKEQNLKVKSDIKYEHLVFNHP